MAHDLPSNAGPLDKTLRRLGSVPVMVSATALVLGFFSLVIWSVWRDYQDTIETEFERLAIHARLSESQISGSFRSIDLLLRTLGERRVKNIDAPADSFRSELKNSLGLIPEITALFAANARGITYSHTEGLTNPAVDNFDASQREYFKRHAQSASTDLGLFVSKPFKGNSGRHVFTASRAMRGAGGEFLGVVVARLELDAFAEVFRPLATSETSSISLTFTDGDMLFRWPDPASFIGRNFRKGKLFSEHIEAGKPETRHRGVTSTDGVERMAVFRRITPDNLTVGVASDFNAVSERWRRNSLQRLGALALIIAITALSFYLIQRRQRELERARRFSERIINTANVMVVGLDRQGGVVLCNALAEQVTGYSRAELLGTRWFERMVPRDRYPQIWSTVLASRETSALPVNMETPLLTKDGLERQIEWRSTSLDDPASTMAMVAFGLDVTERKHAESALQSLNEQLEERVAQRTRQLVAAKDEAERANQAKSEFLSRMSHELRTPLNAILGFGQLLERRPAEPPPPGHVREILRAGHHLLDLINEVLDLSRVESGMLTVSPEPVALLPLLQDCLTLVSPQAQAHGVRILDASSHCDVHVRADRTRLKQVLLNLLSNAIKYNRPTGTVSVVCVAEDGAHPPSLCLRICDTGAGLTPEQQAQLFVPFERLDAEKRQIQGTGIGLALSRRLVELMQGRIGVESTPGTGSVFWVRLPLAQAHAEPAPPTAPAPATAACARTVRHDVLCIEDNPANLHLIESIFAHRPDIRLLSALAPGLGLELARTYRPALILLDINLPDMDGYAVLQCLRENALTRDIPVVAISANAMPKDRARGLAAGFAEYLTKPVDIARLLEIVAEFTGEAASRRGD